MRAAVFVGTGRDLVLEDLDPLPPGPGDAVVRVTASGVCHSDLSLVDGTIAYPPPQIVGHEAAGVVEAVGAQVGHVRPGDRVIASLVPSCRRCFYCERGQWNLCTRTQERMAEPRALRPDGTRVAAYAGLGTFAETMTVDAGALVKVESDLPDEQIALLGCGVTTGVGAALNTARVEPGASVAVIGCGGVGQAVIQGCRIAGAARIFAIDPVELKREVSLRLGATHALDPGERDPVAAVQEQTGGRGVDYAFEVAGQAATIRQAFDLTRPGGACVIVGVPSAEVTLPVSAMLLVMQEKRILGCAYGSAFGPRDFPRFLALAEQGRLRLSEMVSRRLRLDDVNSAFKAMRAGEVIRSVIV